MLHSFSYQRVWALLFLFLTEGCGNCRGTSFSAHQEVTNNNVSPSPFPTVNVAFIGNSFQFVNDLPRVLQDMSLGRIAYQDSVLHGGLRFESLLQKGNGMYGRWNSTNAFDETTGKHDYGSCTVKQLLLGKDPDLEVGDSHSALSDKNPCLQDPEYLAHTIQTKQRHVMMSNNDQHEGMPKKGFWDFIILNDQSMRPAIPKKRQKSIQVLKESYAPLIRQINGAVPVVMMTWAYWRDDIDMIKQQVGEDVPTFTSRLYEGYRQYANALEESLVSSSPLHLPRIAPVGFAFLLVYEEDHDLWKDHLFEHDQYHPSPIGTYLAGLVLYATMFEELPPLSATCTSSHSSLLASMDDDESLWKRARSMQFSGPDLPLPTTQQIMYLRNIAKRVGIDGERPKSLPL